MPASFTSAAKRDELRDRLLAMAESMQRSFDQGHTGKIWVNEEMIGDIITAAGVVGCADVHS